MSEYNSMFFTALDANGDPISGAKQFFYENGTTTLQAVYSDPDRTTPLTNPVVADSAGRFPQIFLNDKLYSIKLTDASYVTVKTLDNVNKFVADTVASLNASSATFFAQNISTTTALNFGYEEGRINNGDGTTTTIPAGTVTLADAATNIVYIDYGAKTIKAAVSGSQPGGGISPLFSVLTASGSIDTVTPLSTSYAASSFPVGGELFWPGSNPPAGFLEEDGTAISRTTYAALFAVIGTTYGAGDGSTTFNLPDPRGRAVRVWDNGAGVDPDAASRIDRGDGTTGDNVGTDQDDEIKSHNHSGGSATLAGSGGPATRMDGGTQSTNSTGGNETRMKNTYRMLCIKY